MVLAGEITATITAATSSYFCPPPPLVFLLLSQVGFWLLLATCLASRSSSKSHTHTQSGLDEAVAYRRRPPPLAPSNTSSCLEKKGCGSIHDNDNSNLLSPNFLPRSSWNWVRNEVVSAPAIFIFPLLHWECTFISHSSLAVRARSIHRSSSSREKDGLGPRNVGGGRTTKLVSGFFLPRKLKIQTLFRIAATSSPTTNSLSLFPLTRCARSFLFLSLSVSRLSGRRTL